MNKKAFTLFFVLLLVFILSLLTIRIYELKSFSSINIINQYSYLQAKNHLSFLEEYMNSLENLSSLQKIQIDDEKYEIVALVQKIEEKKFMIELSVKDRDKDIRVYKKVEIIK